MTNVERAIRQHARGLLTEEEIIAILRTTVSKQDLPTVLALLPDALAALLRESFRNPRRVRTYPPFPDDLWRLLANAEYLAVLSLLPDPGRYPAEAETFRGYPVLGRVEVSDESARAEMIEALRNGIYGDGLPKRCWDPHHGVRAVSAGRPLDLVICFTCECMQAYADAHSDHYEWAYIGKDPEPVLDQVLLGAGVRLGKRQQ